MDLPLTSGRGASAYIALNRLVARTPAPPAGALPGQAPARFAPAAPDETAVDRAPTVAAPVLAGTGPAVAPAGPPSAATATRAVTLYAQTQDLLVGAPPAQLTAAVESSGPSAAAAARQMTFSRGALLDMLT